MTRIKLIIIITLLFQLKVNSQNLVQNPSFEEYNNCPNSISQLNRCTDWSTPNSATTDYYNSCSNSFCSSVPINTAGVQNARTGNGYIGIVTYQKNYAYTELAQCRLIEPLKANRYYKISYYVSAAETSKYFHHSLGAYFSKDSVSFEYWHFPIEKQKYLIKDMNTEIINNTDKWILVSSMYKAKGGEKFIIIGNVYGFIWKGYLEKNKNVKPSIHEVMSYYYIDDVSVIEAKNKKDTEFETKEVISKNEIEIGNTFTIANTKNLFSENSPEMLNMTEIMQQAQQDTGFVPEIAFLGYFANFMVQNPTVTIEVRVYSNTDEENVATTNLSQERAEAIVKYLKKEKVKKDRMAAIGLDVESNGNEINQEKNGMVEIKILKK